MKMAMFLAFVRLSAVAAACILVFGAAWGDLVHRLSPRLAGLARRLLYLAAGHDGLGAGAEGQ